MEISKDIVYVGVNDKNIDLFEGLYEVPNGVSYNSYVILDEKIAILDTVDANFTEEWLENIRNTLQGRSPDYLIIQHMEPDHSASIEDFMKKYSNTIIVSSAKAFSMMRGFFHKEYETRRKIVAEGDSLFLGQHVLNFIAAPLVHWPEVIMTYDSYAKVLFSADAFGTFGSLDTKQEWVEEARRYYFGIVGKFGVPVQKLLKKVSELEIEMICSLHGPVLKENLSYYINLYYTWSSYQPEDKGIVIAYASVYGNTKKAVAYLEEKLKEKGYSSIVMIDLCRDDMSKAIAEAFRHGIIVLASITYNGAVFPPMREFLNNLTERSFQNRTIALIENGSWSATAANVMKKMLSECKNMQWIEPVITISSTMNKKNMEELNQLAEKLFSL